MIVNCYGRIVYRDEAPLFRGSWVKFLKGVRGFILDLSGVSSIDSAGIGELVLLYNLAQAKHADLKFASPSPIVQRLFDLTQLDSFLEVHPA